MSAHKNCYGRIFMNSIDSHIGARLRQKRFQSRLTVASLACRIGIDGAQLLRYENGQERIPAQVLLKFCRVLEISISHLFELTSAGAETGQAAPRDAQCDRPRLHSIPQARPARREAPPPTGEVLSLHDVMIARQAGLVARLENEGHADLARLGQESLALFRETQKLLIRRAASCCDPAAKGKAKDSSTGDAAN
jgi:transcriptional regulator with XRE-family HTH domain